ncbi:hypothetical protein [Pseudonocardia sp. HH130629-09]|uniref:hypothetical protein n=1 Tax=Pseudonocardia sp. HH130629-09 TaxID=1641402 RepID=UPI0011AE2187|nr:hypothetical protein [Pseudonocardia sp. HH130629-09]
MSATEPSPGSGEDPISEPTVGKKPPSRFAPAPAVASTATAETITSSVRATPAQPVPRPSGEGERQ